MFSVSVWSLFFVVCRVLSLVYIILGGGFMRGSDGFGPRAANFIRLFRSVETS